MNLETPKPDTQHIDEAMAVANSAKAPAESVGDGAVILQFPKVQQPEMPQSTNDTLIESYAGTVAERREPAPTKPETRLTLRGKVAVALGSIAAVIGLGAGLHEATDTDFHGEKTVVINEDTVTEIAKNEVDGAASHTGETVDKIVAMNPDVFQNGKAFVESEDLGKDITVPESVD